MEKINGAELPHYFIENPQSNVKLGGMNGLLLELKRRNGLEKRTRNFSIWSKLCLLQLLQMLEELLRSV